jgi:plasmid maintenance system antidote protein VapI
MKLPDVSHLTPEEIVEAYIFPHDLTPEEKAEADKEMLRLRDIAFSKMTEKELVSSELMRLWCVIDNYLQKGKYEKEHDFAVYLQQYIHAFKKKQIDFAAEIGLHPTKLNQILNGKAMPNAALTYRLEKHSGGAIKAHMWWQLIAKRIEHDITNDVDAKRREEKKVTFSLENA